MSEVTKVQTVAVIVAARELPSTLPKSFDTYRTIRKHPTVAMARALRVAPIMASSWAIRADDDVDPDVIMWVEKHLFPFRDDFLKTALTFGNVDFGWQGYEKVWTINEEGRFTLHKLKPLLHDITEILIDRRTGEFAGFVQDRDQTELDTTKAMLVSFQVEGTNWYGEPLLENVRPRYDEWVEANQGAARYDKKLAGTHWLVRYPPGSSRVDGAEVDNSTVASDVLNALKSSGSVSFPNTRRDLQSDDPMWDIEMKSDTAKQASFVPRLEYLDKLMVRGLILPERSITEGKFGTKAEAGEHANFALTNMELLHSEVTKIFNEGVVKPVLAANHGPKVADMVDLIAMPVMDEKKQWFKDLYKQLLANPGALLEELATIDTDAIKDALDVPKTDASVEGVGLDERTADVLKIRGLMDDVMESDDVGDDAGAAAG